MYYSLQLLLRTPLPPLSFTRKFSFIINSYNCNLMIMYNHICRNHSVVFVSVPVQKHHNINPKETGRDGYLVYEPYTYTSMYIYGFAIQQRRTLHQWQLCWAATNLFIWSVASLAFQSSCPLMHQATKRLRFMWYTKHTFINLLTK
jgi:hypothetical protein